MNTKNFIQLLGQPHKISPDETAALKTVVEAYPFFQSARALYLKGLQNQESFSYNSELKRAASHTTDRSMLFEFITSKAQEEHEIKPQEIHRVIVKKVEEEAPIEIANELNLGKPIPFDSNETHSFNEWLQLGSFKKIDRKSKPSLKEKDKKAIIEDFIKHNPKIIRVDKERETIVEVRENKGNSHLMTETLAKVYLEQNKFENAIKAYEILSLKYPEKSGFFADQIKRIRILQKNKS